MFIHKITIMTDRYQDKPDQQQQQQDQNYGSRDRDRDHDRDHNHDHHHHHDHDHDDDHDHDHDRDDDRDCGCKESKGNYPTDKSIKKERDKLCIDLYASAGEVYQYEKRHESISEREGYKKCSFVWSEEYYHYYRDLNLAYGSKLLQSSESIKERVTVNTNSGNELSGALQEIVKSAKDLKTKMLDLSKAADDLKWATKDPCNKAAMTIITGKPQEGCKDQKPEPEPVRECEDAEDIFRKLIKWPHLLTEDLVRLIKSAADVKGIQVFSNVGTLDQLQKKLNEEAKDFDTKVQETIKKAEAAVKNSYGELAKVAQELARADVDRYTKRSIFEGLLDATRDVCCYHCDCLKDDSCHEKICKICKAILPDEATQQQQQQQQHQHQQGY